MSTSRVQHFIGGRRVDDASSDRVQDNVNPASGQVLAEVPLDSVASADEAVASAREAFPDWAALPVGERCQHFFRYKQVLEDHFEELATLIVQEHGKTMAEARGDVRRGIDCVEYACAAPSLLMGHSLPQIAVSSSFCRTEDEGGVGIDSRAPAATRSCSSPRRRCLSAPYARSSWRTRPASRRACSTW
ncbi:MAG: aldehyde dehydrogenase family protein [Planctomycetota bacterium]|jgi:malonate-semialdehyde dehydrogenase (acetylating)/methylmalonate-semialdehyde dehydrogenase